MKPFSTTILLIAGLTFSLHSSAKKISTKAESDSSYVQTETLRSSEFCPDTDKLPLFPGGDKGFINFIRSNVRYPQKALRKKIQGRVVLSVIIDTDGRISDVEVVENVDPSLDKEAIRVVKKMPKWEPGERNGEKVRVRHTIPIVFNLL